MIKAKFKRAVSLVSVTRRRQIRCYIGSLFSSGFPLGSRDSVIFNFRVRASLSMATTIVRVNALINGTRRGLGIVAESPETRLQILALALSNLIKRIAPSPEYEI